MARYRKSMEDNRRDVGSGRLLLRSQLLSIKGCGRYCWHTGSAEITLAIVGAIIGTALCFGYDEQTGFSTVALLAFVLGGAAIAIIPTILRNEFIIPSGMCIQLPPYKAAPKAMIALGTIGELLAYWQCLVNQAGSDVMLGMGLALLALAAYLVVGRGRFLVLSAWLMVASMYAPASVESLSLGSVQAFGAAMMLYACGIMVSGAGAFFYAFYHAVNKRYAAEGGDMSDFMHSVASWFSKQELEDALTSKSDATRYLTCTFLQDYCEPKVLAALIRSTRDPEPAIAHAAMVALSNIWGPDPEEILRWELKRGIVTKDRKRIKCDLDDVPADMVAAVSREHEMLLEDTVRHESEIEQVLRTEVAQDEVALSQLIALASGPHDSKLPVGEVATQLLGATRSHKAYAALVGMILDGERPRTRAAIEGFHGAGASAAVHLSALLADPREWVRVAGIRAADAVLESTAAEGGKEADTAKLLLHDESFALARHPKVVTRGAALLLLGHYDQEGRELIEEASRSRHGLMRGEALQALLESGVTNASERLLGALADNSAYVRATAIRCAEQRRMGSLSSAIERLRDSDHNSRIKEMARHFLTISKLW